MKALPLLMVTAVSLAASLIPLQADTLYSDGIKVTGTIEQAPPTTGAAPVVYQLAKISDILTFLGSSADPKKQRWYWDNTLRGYVIAEKGIKSSDSATPTVQFYIFGSGTVGTTYVQVRVAKGKGIFSSNENALEGNLTSTSVQTDVFGGGHETDTTTFTAYGAVNSVNTIMVGKIVDSYSVLNRNIHRVLLKPFRFMKNSLSFLCAAMVAFLSQYCQGGYAFSLQADHRSWHHHHPG
ncbi:MAG: hypothetical protein QM796_03395 [Chthoniobacteraceae bacterium]